ncbi:V-type ATP synthase subunit E family protein [uncultured Intestinimonas sp.]|uniref:V-type ATP synthase subunit E n=1 Tax=uncultured Intestinimonas sp. TaxID=1689265 RepID=UPI0025E321A1|nr:V-type ATP synthase subunit E family protein [uncultured Intestinimonas sp.]
MNGIEKITGQIDADVQKEIDAALDQARAQAQEIEARYESQAQTQAEAIRRKGEQDAALRQERLVDVAKLEARKTILAARQDMVGQAFDLALKKLLELPDQEYIALLAKLAVAASRTGHEQVIFSQKDRSRYGKQVVTMANDMLAKKAGPRADESAGRLTLAEESRPMAGGLILRDGRVETNCSFEVLIHLQRDALSAEVARALFA